MLTVCSHKQLTMSLSAILIIILVLLLLDVYQSRLTDSVLLMVPSRIVSVLQDLKNAL